MARLCKALVLPASLTSSMYVFLIPKSVKIPIVNHALTNQDACNAYDVVKSMTPSMPVLMKYNRLKKFF